MADDSSDQRSLFSGKTGVLLIAMGLASFFVTVYHLIFLCCHHARHTRRLELAAAAAATLTADTREGNTPISDLIPAHKYVRKNGVVDGDEDDGTCAVCLGDFEEGEELRTLPLCMHSFHVPCIDMWLHSHSTCPVCRTIATPSPAVAHQLPEIAPSEVNTHQSIDMTPIALAQIGFGR